MASFKQMKTLVEPFLAAHPDFVLDARVLFRIPIQHLMVGMEFERTGHSDQVALRWYITCLFAPPPYLRSGPSLRMDRSWGFVDDADLQPRVLREMDVALDELNVRTAALEDVLGLKDVFVGHTEVLGDQTIGLLHAASGHFLEAAAYLQIHVDRLRRGSRNWHENQTHPEGSDRQERARARFLRSEAEADEIDVLIRHLRRKDTDGVAGLLHTWEAMSVEVHGLERYWMPSPFPFENG